MRTFLLATALCAVVVVDVVSHGRNLHAQVASSSNGYVLRPEEGERIFGTSLIKVSPDTGSANVGMALMRTDPNGRSGVHIHDLADQIVLVSRGSGYAVLGNTRSPIAAGDTIFIPRGIWHDVAAGPEGMESVEIFVPSGVEAEMREVDRVTDGGRRPITLDELNRIAAKYGTRHQDLGQ